MEKGILNLQRFIDAQKECYERALEEIKSGRKQSHWMWYIFPQVKGLGKSFMAEKYAIKNKDEAVEYFKNPILKQHLLEITNEFLKLENLSAYNILGTPDDLKMKSSMTLFDAIQDETNVFNEVLTKYFQKKRCETTLRLLGKVK